MKDTLSLTLQEQFQINAASVGTVLIVSTLFVLFAVTIILVYNAIFVRRLSEVDRTATLRLSDPLLNSTITAGSVQDQDITATAGSVQDQEGDHFTTGSFRAGSIPPIEYGAAC